MYIIGVKYVWDMYEHNAREDQKPRQKTQVVSFTKKSMIELPREISSFILKRY